MLDCMQAVETSNFLFGLLHLCHSRKEESVVVPGAAAVLVHVALSCRI